jgi:hypothetical protein
LEVGGFRLLLEKKILNSAELSGDVGLCFPPLLEVVGKVFGFEVERTPRGFFPTLLCHFIKVLFQKPPVLKAKERISFRARRMHHSKNRGVISLNHR